MMKTSPAFLRGIGFSDWWTELTSTRFALANKPAHWGHRAPPSFPGLRLGFFLAACLVWASAPLPAAAAETLGPAISLSVRGVGDGIVEQGEPLRVTVRLAAPRGVAGSIELAPASGTWSDAIAVELAPAAGGAAVARAEAVGKPTTPNATLNAKRIAGGLWLISSTSMERIVPGDYVVRARLALTGGSGWNGEVIAGALPIQVSASSDSAYRVTQRAINRAHEALLGGRSEEAASIVDAVLQRTPDDERLLTVRADIANRAGNPMAAFICLNRADRVSPPTGEGPPPFEREELAARAQASLTGDKPAVMNPPAWSWPPAAVLAVPDVELLALTKPKAVSSPTLPAAANPPAGAMTTPAKSTAIPAPTPAVAPTNLSPAIAGGAANAAIVPSAELSDAKNIADSTGQWATSAIAGSQYGKTQYSAAQATGAPNISVAGNSPDAWCPANKNSGTDWLEVTFAKPVHATEVRVRQNDATGAIAKIEAIEPDGTAHLWWEGVDPYQAPAVREIAWFAVRVPRTAYLVAKVRIALNLATGPGWKEIDAVQLVSAAQ